MIGIIKSSLRNKLLVGLIVLAIILLVGLPARLYLKNLDVSKEGIGRIDEVDLTEVKSSKIKFDKKIKLSEIHVMDPRTSINLSKLSLLNKQVLKYISTKEIDIKSVLIDEENFLSFKLKNKKKIAKKYRANKGVFINKNGVVYLAKTLEPQSLEELVELIKLGSEFDTPDFRSKVLAIKNPINIKANKPKKGYLTIVKNKSKSKDTNLDGLVIFYKDKNISSESSTTRSLGNSGYNSLIVLLQTSTDFSSAANNFIKECTKEDDGCSPGGDLSEEATPIPETKDDLEDEGTIPEETDGDEVGRETPAPTEDLEAGETPTIEEIPTATPIPDPIVTENPGSTPTSTLTPTPTPSEETPFPTPTPECGNGVVESGNAEECDDGSANGSTGCSSDCKVQACCKCLYEKEHVDKLHKTRGGPVIETLIDDSEGDYFSKCCDKDKDLKSYQDEKRCINSVEKIPVRTLVHSVKSQVSDRWIPYSRCKEYINPDEDPNECSASDLIVKYHGHTTQEFDCTTFVYKLCTDTKEVKNLSCHFDSCSLMANPDKTLRDIEEAYNRLKSVGLDVELSVTGYQTGVSNNTATCEEVANYGTEVTITVGASGTAIIYPKCKTLREESPCDSDTEGEGAKCDDSPEGECGNNNIKNYICRKVGDSFKWEPLS